MTSILDLPEETLSLILENLKRKDLQQCQTVCRSLYLPAHLLFLRDIDLCGSRVMVHFICCIDFNDNPSYLKAVKTITLRDTNKDEVALDNHLIQKLFFRFPNLQQVQLVNSLHLFREFNDDICRELLKCCPKLDVFEEIGDPYKSRSDYDLSLLLKLRLLLTSGNFRDHLYNAKQFGGTANMITCFPRLTKIEVYSKELDNFEKWLPILPKVPKLKNLHILVYEGCRSGFAEDYLATLTRHDQDELLTALSKIERLKLSHHASVFTRNIEGFVTKYLTALNCIDFRVVFEEEWDTSQQLDLCNNYLDLLEYRNKHGNICFEGTTTDIAANCFPVILDRVFHKSNGHNRRLYIEFVEWDGWELDVEVKEGRNISFFINWSDAANVLKCLFEKDDQTIPRHDIDDLELAPDCSSDNFTWDITMYFAYLQAIPSLKKLTLHIPDFYVEHGGVASDLVLPNVVDLIIVGIQEKQPQALLDTLAITFPNLLKLQLDRLSVSLDQEEGKFSLALSKYSLETLAIDLSYLETTVETPLNKDWFQVDVRLSLHHQRRLYKVALDLSTATIINPSDLQGSDKILTLHIAIYDVKGIKLFKYDTESDTEYVNLVLDNNLV